MNKKLITISIAIFSTLAVTNISRGQLLSDEFNDSSIDSGLWQPSTPFANSSITESGGNATFLNRGRLLSVGTLPGVLDITGRFRFVGNVHDQFKILTRTNGVATNPSQEFDLGIVFSFAIMNDSGSTTAPNFGISRHGYPGDSPTLTNANFGFALNTFYDFRITDDGTNVALYINDLNSPLLTATDSTVISNRLGIYNREGMGSISAGSTVQLDFIHVVPEPSSAILLLSGAALCLRRRLLRPHKRIA